MVNPVILGSGNPLFKNITDRHKLQFVNIKTFRSGNVLLYYRPAANKKEV